MFTSQEAKTETYTTSDWDHGKKGAPSDPIIALCEMPGERIHVLDDIRNSYGPKKWISVGASSTSDIRLTERLRPGEARRVSRKHCRLCRTPQGRILVEPHAESTNHTKVNRARVHGPTELTPGDVLEVGRIRLVGVTASGARASRPAAPRASRPAAPSASRSPPTVRVTTSLA